MALGKFKLALKDFEAVKRAKPRDRDAVAKYTECSKIVKQQAFAKAIAVESSKSVSKTIQLETIGECESQYCTGSSLHTSSWILIGVIYSSSLLPPSPSLLPLPPSLPPLPHSSGGE